MDLFKGYRLEQGKDGYTLLLFINDNITEFAGEFGDYNKLTTDKIKGNVKDYVKHNFKDITITTVKLVLGSTIIATLVLGSPGHAADTDTLTTQTINPSTYTVASGDTLWGISKKFGISIDELKRINNLTSDTIYVGQVLKLSETQTGAQVITKTFYNYHTVVSGDSLWLIAKNNNVTVDYIKKLNNLTSDTIRLGQTLKVREVKVDGIMYIVKSGDTLWGISQTYKTTINSIKSLNNLTGDTLRIGQELFISPNNNVVLTPTTPPEQTPSPVYNWPAVTYIVQPGDSVSSVAKKFNTTSNNILKYNYMEPNEWLNAGDKIAISGYAPRTYTVTPGEAVSPQRVGKIVNWVTEGQYLIKRGDVFTVVDVNTGKQFKAKMLGGYNHSDIEPLTAADTEIMRQMYGTWEWSPRAVVVFIDGMNIAASLSGMPHGADTISNGVSGHFDMYLLNSSPHSETASQAYIDQHRAMVLKAGGQ